MSRQKQTGVILAGLLLVIFFAAIDHSLVSPGWQNRRASLEQRISRDYQKYHNKTFTAVYIVDGDTLDIDIPDGQKKRTRIRLWGIDTPETKSEEFGIMYFGPEAAEYTRKLTLQKEVTLYLDEGSDTRDKYDRLLAYIQLPDGRFLNEILLKDGFAYADLRFQHSFYNKYQNLEASARNLKKGLWEKVTREQLPQWLQREKPTLLLKK